MIDRGKRERSEARRPWLEYKKHGRGLKGRNRRRRITPFQGWVRFLISYEGRRASRLPLAIIFRAFVAKNRALGAKNRAFGAKNRAFGAKNRAFGAKSHAFSAKSRAFGAL